MGDCKPFLSRVPLFFGLTESQLDLLSEGSVRRAYPRGKVICLEGEPPRAMYILLAGKAKVLQSDPEGKEVILAILGPGEFFGEMSLIDEEPRSASVVTIDRCEFISVSRDMFKSLLVQSPELCMSVMKGLVRRLREADRRINTLALLDVYGRVARILLDLSEPLGETRIVRHLPPRQEIAKMIGASREAVSRVMKGLELQGYVRQVAEGHLILGREPHDNLG